MLGVGRDGPLGPVRFSGPSRFEGGRPARETRISGGTGPAARASLAEDREALAVLASVDGLGPVLTARLLDAFGSPQAVLAAALGPGGAGRIVEATMDPQAEGRRIPGTVAARLVAAAYDGPAIVAGILRSGVELVALHDPAYPPRLRAIALPPHLLFIRGRVGALAMDRAVAVVGTRRPTDAGRSIAARIGLALSRVGACVVSGLAIGIDGAAHAAALDSGGTTVAVIGGGHDRLFPRAHGRLADAIAAGGGAVVSEFPPSTEPTRGTFPRRNRLISGLASATVVVEAAARSGALTTAAWALEQGRGCFLVPGGIDAPASAGCLSFLRDCHAEARIVAGIPQLLDDLGFAGPEAGSQASVATADRRSTGRAPSAGAVLASLGTAERTIAAAMVDGMATADELVATTGLSIAAVLSTITLLEGRGLAVGAYGRYRPSGALATVSPGRQR